MSTVITDFLVTSIFLDESQTSCLGAENMVVFGVDLFHGFAKVLFSITLDMAASKFMVLVLLKLDFFSLFWGLSFGLNKFISFDVL